MCLGKPATPTVHGPRGRLEVWCRGPTSRVANCSHEQRPDEVFIVTSLPMTPSGKVDRQRLLEEGGRQPGGTVALAAPSNTVEFGTGAVNSGTFQVARGAALVVESASSFTQSAGTLAAAGAITLFNGTFTLAGGSESDGPVLLADAALVDGPGTIGFNLTGTSNLSGDIPAGQTVTLTTNDADSNVFLLGSTTVRGALVIAPSGSLSAGATYVAIDGAVTGKFSAYAFGSHSYSVQYAAGTVSSNEVVLTAG